MAIEALSGWTKQQKSAVIASYLGWTLDALDFFLLVFVIRDAAAAFGPDTATISIAVTLTLALRPLGAFIFGRLADRVGRRPALMLNIGVFSMLSFATAFVPDIWSFMLVRALFGIGMVLASGCGNKTLVRVGTGNLKSLTVLLVGMVASYLMLWSPLFEKAFLPWLQPATINLAQHGMPTQHAGEIGRAHV